MRIPADIPGAFPLIDIQAGRAGQHDIRLQHVHPGKGPVALAGKLRFHMLIFFFQQGIVRGGGQVQHGFPALFHLVAEGLEDRIIALAVGEKHKRRPGFAFVAAFPAAEENLQFHPAVAECVDRRPDDTDQDREQHAPRAGIDIESHLREPPSCLRQTGFGFSAPAGPDP